MQIIAERTIKRSCSHGSKRTVTMLNRQLTLPLCSICNTLSVLAVNYVVYYYYYYYYHLYCCYINCTLILIQTLYIYNHHFYDKVHVTITRVAGSAKICSKVLCFHLLYTALESYRAVSFVL